MKVLFLGNGWAGRCVLTYLVKRNVEVYPWTVAGAAPPDTQWLAAHPFDMCLSIMYPHILSGGFIKAFPRGVVNLHPALLPYCRGMHPAFWAMAEALPAGATIHCVDEGVDTGNIIGQVYVKYCDDTVCSRLYEVCLERGIELFKQLWGKIEVGTNKSVPQPHHKATFHLAREVQDTAVFALTAKEIRNEYRNRKCDGSPRS